MQEIGRAAEHEAARCWVSSSWWWLEQAGLVTGYHFRPCLTSSPHNGRYLVFNMLLNYCREDLQDLVMNWALIWSLRNLKIFFAGISQGPLETSPGTIGKIQKRVQGPPARGFWIFLVFVKNITKLKIWLSRPHFWADFQVSYHFGKLLTVRLQGHTASKNLSLHQWDMSISNFQNWIL